MQDARQEVATTQAQLAQSQAKVERAQQTLGKLEAEAAVGISSTNPNATNFVQQRAAMDEVDLYWMTTQIWKRESPHG